MTRIEIDGRSVEVDAGISVAAALLNSGVTSFRQSVRGEPRAPLCAMGICHECRVTIDGVAHRRSCLVEVSDGMQVHTGAPRPLFSESRGAGSETILCDVAVIGAGPAGIAAAVTASESGAGVVVLDDSPRAGGQIWRHSATTRMRGTAGKWLDRLERSSVRMLTQTSVANVTRTGDSLSIIAERKGRAVLVEARALVLATGARERFLPFPGSTLPNVMGIGALQAMLKSGLSLRGKRVVIAGSGPLLLPVAAAVAKSGARLQLVAEQAPLSSVMQFTRALWRHPSAIVQAARYRAAFMGTSYSTGTWVSAARGTAHVEEADVTDGVTTRTIKCDVLSVAHGLIPNDELARQLGCAMQAGAVIVNDRLESSVPGVLCAGELTGIGGVDIALIEGMVAGASAVGGSRRKDRHAALRRMRVVQAQMNAAFALRPELRGLATSDALVCRCEDVALRDTEPGWTMRKTKLYTRAGMGACQGRVCGAALDFLHGGEADSVRLPVQPVQLTTLLATPAGAAAHNDTGEGSNG